MIATDTHTHLYVEQFEEDRDEVVERALKAGVKRLFLPAIDSSYTQVMLKMKAAYPENIFLMAGLHPTHVKTNYQSELDHVEYMLREHDICAVGEIGIDLYWDRTYLSEQQDTFARQIRLAKHHQLPIVIHCRESFDEIIEVLDAEGTDDLRGIFHCFTGNQKQAYQAIDRNMKLGIGGVVTFKNGKIDQFLNEIDPSNIVLETDSPYLAPVPFRGKRNESSYLLYVLDKLAEIYGMERDELAAITTDNSKQIFGL